MLDTIVIIYMEFGDAFNEMNFHRLKKLKEYVKKNIILKFTSEQLLDQLEQSNNARIDQINSILNWKPVQHLAFILWMRVLTLHNVVKMDSISRTFLENLPAHVL